ncbi:Guanine nucleotide exchange factor MSS4 -like protein [Halotydeus destructor]|nr:Guanine nucleotide exchange factor MSS4 -like protein [Halotydeus destructor]
MSETEPEKKSAIANVEEGSKSPFDVSCNKCNCLLLRSGHGVYVTVEKEIPTTTIVKDDAKPVKEKLSKFYCVDDIFTFENMGFSNDVDGTKYLVCAECETGPLGFHDLDTKKSYVSLDRVKLN